MKGKILYYPIFPDPDALGSERSDDVRAWVEKFLIPAGIATFDEKEANAYLIASGDRGLMAAAREKRNQGKVLFGVNRGTRGFLLNPINEINLIPTTFEELDFISVKLIQGEFIKADGSSTKLLAFNDIVCGGEIADYIHFKISGSLSHFPNRKVEGSGIIVSTPQGTTGFPLKVRGSSAMLPLDTDHWFVCGLATGPYPNDQVTPQKIEIELSARNPVNGYADGHANRVKDVKKIVITPTEDIITLGFLKGIDFAARRTSLAQKIERGE